MCVRKANVWQPKSLSYPASIANSALSFPAFRYAPSLKVSTNSLKWNFILLQLAPMRRKSKLKDYSYFPFMARSIFYPSCTTQKFPGIKLRSVFDYPMNPLFAFLKNPSGCLIGFHPFRLLCKINPLKKCILHLCSSQSNSIFMIFLQHHAVFPRQHKI